MSDLLLPRELPDGSIVYTDDVDSQAIGYRLRNGDATLGWPGDPALALVRNTVKDRWEVWRHHEDGSKSIVGHRAGTRLPGNELILSIRDHDTRLVDVLAGVERQNDELERRREQRFREQTGEAGDKLAWALGRDLDEPAQDGRVFPLR